MITTSFANRTPRLSHLRLSPDAGSNFGSGGRPAADSTKEAGITPEMMSQLGAQFPAGNVLRAALPPDFKSGLYTLSLKDGNFALNHTGKFVNFGQMLGLRGKPSYHAKDPQSATTLAAALKSGTEIPVSNVGVSSYPVVEISGAGKFLIAVTQKDHIKLPSGYVGEEAHVQHDKLTGITPREVLLNTIVRETVEEVIPTRIGEENKVQIVPVYELLDFPSYREHLPQSEHVCVAPYPNLSTDAYTGIPEWKIEPALNTSILKALPSLSKMPSVTVNGETLEGAYAHIDGVRGSVQVILPVRVSFENLHELTLMHAETAAKNVKVESGEKQVLAEMLHEDGLLLLKLDESGKLTGEANRLVHGNLVPQDISNKTLSEVFSPDISDSIGITAIPGIKVTDYLALQSRPSA